MRTKIKRLSSLVFFAIIFYISEKLYVLFLNINWLIEEQQRKRGYKDRGEVKYDIEHMIRMAMEIPKYTVLEGPQIKKLFPDLSKEHCYKIIDIRIKIDKKNPEAPRFWEIHRKIIMNDMA